MLLLLCKTFNTGNAKKERWSWIQRVTTKQRRYRELLSLVMLKSIPCFLQLVSQSEVSQRRERNSLNLIPVTQKLSNHFMFMHKTYGQLVITFWIVMKVLTARLLINTSMCVRIKSMIWLLHLYLVKWFTILYSLAKTKLFVSLSKIKCYMFINLNLQWLHFH